MTDIIRHKDEISHKRQNTYTIHALFADSHVTACNDEVLFDNEIWAQAASGVVDETTLCYRAFRLISP
jgi:hypothetical protein